DAQERYPPAVGRPHRGIVAIHAGIRIMHRFGRSVVHPDEAVIPAVAHKRQPRAIRRPMQPAVLPAGVDQLFRLFLAIVLTIVLAVERRRPDLALAHESHASAFRRYGWLVAFTDQPRR